VQTSKKIERTAKEELSLLVEQGYLTEFCKVSSDLVGEENEKIVSSDVNIMFESEAHTERGSPSLVGCEIANPQEFHHHLLAFESYLKSQNKRNAKQILCYAQRYHSVLVTGDATAIG
jgi:predicted cupin superfamily sugar epimerase